MDADRVLIDTGPLVAIFRERDEHHELCVETARQLQSPQFTCWPVITEASYLLNDSPESVQKLLAKVATGDLVILPLTRDDAPSIAQILAKYQDQDPDLADACLVHLAKRESMPTVFSIDRRHFSVYRTASGTTLTLLPE